MVHPVGRSPRRGGHRQDHRRRARHRHPVERGGARAARLPPRRDRGQARGRAAPRLLARPCRGVGRAALPRPARPAERAGHPAAPRWLHRGAGAAGAPPHLVRRGPRVADRLRRTARRGHGPGRGVDAALLPRGALHDGGLRHRAAAALGQPRPGAGAGPGAGGDAGAADPGDPARTRIRVGRAEDAAGAGDGRGAAAGVGHAHARPPAPPPFSTCPVGRRWGTSPCSWPAPGGWARSGRPPGSCRTTPPWWPGPAGRPPSGLAQLTESWGTRQTATGKTIRAELAAVPALRRPRPEGLLASSRLPLHRFTTAAPAAPLHYNRGATKPRSAEAEGCHPCISSTHATPVPWPR